MRIGGGSISNSFLTSALDGGKWPVSRPGRFTPEEEPPELTR